MEDFILDFNLRNHFIQLAVFFFKKKIAYFKIAIPLVLICRVLIKIVPVIDVGAELASILHVSNPLSLLFHVFLNLKSRRDKVIFVMDCLALR